MSAAAIAQKRRQKCLVSVTKDSQTSTTTKLAFILDSPNETVGFRGAVRLHVDQGEALIWGYKLSPDSEPLDCVFVAGGVQAIEALKVPCRITVTVSSEDKNWCEIAEVVPSLRYLFPVQDNDNNIKVVTTTTDHELVRTNADSQNFIIPEEEEPLIRPLESWKTFALTSSASQVIVVGPRSSGKTSFTRYLVNQQLAKYGAGSVAYLDFDPGQPENGLSGLLSLKLPKKPLLGESFARTGTDSHDEHYQTLKSVFFGATSPRDNPELYRRCVKDLLQSYRQLGETALLVVNTAGWIKGLGYNLLCEIAQQVSTLVSDGHDGLTVVSMGPAEEFSHFNLYSVEPVPIKSPSSRTINSADYRTINQVCYFNTFSKTTSPSWLHYTEMTPYEVPFSLFVGISIWGVSEGLSPDDIETILSATPVALVRLNSDPSSGTIIMEKNGLRFLDDSVVLDPENSTYLCQAIVQSINIETQKIRLIIPKCCLPQDDKRLVLVRGRLQLSLYEVWNPKLVGSHQAPFLSYLDHRGIGSQHWRVRRNIRRIA